MISCSVVCIVSFSCGCSKSYGSDVMLFREV